jgi:Holliday junction resolvasome RuvABC endonuclease subunit
MAKKMEYNQISHELRQKQLKLKSDYSDYSSVNSPIIVECINGHEIHTTLKTVRLKNFTCSQCVGTATKGKHVFTTVVPQKTGYRVIGFDNASHNMGVAIFDNGKLVYYNLLTFNQGTATQRLNKIRDTLENQILPLWQPDVIQIEGIQHQNSYATYEVLVKLIGIFEMACDRFGINLEKTRSSTWRSHFAINHRKREDDKKAAIQTIKDMYDIDTTDDVAEAILIAKYRSDLLNKGKVEDLF